MENIITSTEMQINGYKVHMSFQSEENRDALTEVRSILSSFAKSYLDNRTQDNAVIPPFTFDEQKGMVDNE